MNKYSPRDYYIKNKQKLIEASKRSYHNRIKNMTQDELLDFRKQKSEYFRQWYLKKRGISEVRKRVVKERKVTTVTTVITVVTETIETTETTFRFTD